MWLGRRRETDEPMDKRNQKKKVVSRTVKVSPKSLDFYIGNVCVHSVLASLFLSLHMGDYSVLVALENCSACPAAAKEMDTHRQTGAGSECVIPLCSPLRYIDR